MLLSIKKKDLPMHNKLLDASLFLSSVCFLTHSLWQTDEDCCNSCDEVREAYRKKGWGMTNPDLIDQVGYRSMLFFFLAALSVLSDMS